MANVIVPNKPAKDIIRIDGICYYLKGSTSSPPTHTNDDIQAEYDNCDDCALDDLSSESSSSNSSSSLSIILPPELPSSSSSSGLISSSSSVGFSSSSSFEVSIGNACYYMCIESDWSVANISGTYTYDTNTNSWKQDGGNGELIYLGEPGDISGQWAITHPSSTATDNVVYEALTGLGGDPCPPLNGWSFVPAAGGTESTFNIQEGTCEAVQSSDSSSEGFSSSSSSLGFSSSSSSSSSPALSESSSQSAAAVNVCLGDTCGGSNEPNLQLTIIDPDYTGGTITWCGKDWTQQQVKDGLTQCVCPQLWNTGYSSGSYFGDFWQYGGGLSMQRGNQFNGTRHEIRFAQPVAPFNTYYDNRTQSAFFNFGNTLGVLSLGTPWVNPNVDSNINDNFFGQVQGNPYGSFTDGNGIEYRWEKGINWP